MKILIIGKRKGVLYWGYIHISSNHNKSKSNWICQSVHSELFRYIDQVHFLQTKPVRARQEGLQCDGCLRWQHWSVAPEYASLITAMQSKTVLQLTGAVQHATSLRWSLLLKALLLTSSPLSAIHLPFSLSTSHPTYLQLTLSKILLSMSHPLSNRPQERMTRPAQHL